MRDISVVAEFVVNFATICWTKTAIITYYFPELHACELYIQRNVLLERVFHGRRQLEVFDLRNGSRLVAVMFTLCPGQLNAEERVWLIESRSGVTRGGGPPQVTPSTGGGWHPNDSRNIFAAEFRRKLEKRSPGKERRREMVRVVTVVYRTMTTKVIDFWGKKRWHHQLAHRGDTNLSDATDVAQCDHINRIIRSVNKLLSHESHTGYVLYNRSFTDHLVTYKAKLRFMLLFCFCYL